MNFDVCNQLCRFIKIAISFIIYNKSARNAVGRIIVSACCVKIKKHCFPEQSGFFYAFSFPNVAIAVQNSSREIKNIFFSFFIYKCEVSYRY